MSKFIPEFLIKNVLLNASRTKLSTQTAFRSMIDTVAGGLPKTSDVVAEFCRDGGQEIAVYDAEQKTSLPGRMARGEEGVEHTDPVVNNAFDYSSATFNFLKEVLGRNSIDNKNHPLISTVHYGKNYPNAFWNGRQITFGDGDGEIFKNFCILDIIGHEWSHGLTSKTANLRYYAQSGALNEHFSDVFGMCIKQRELKQASKDASWIVGEGIFCDGINGVGIRSMRLPGSAFDDEKIGKDRQTKHMSEYYDTDEDNGGVHWHSGIVNRLFYEYCINIGGNSFDGPAKIWGETLTTKLNSNSNFQDFVNSTQEVIISNFGAGEEYKCFKEASKVVGLTPRHPIFNQMGL